jgi:hypothetical protein
MNSLAPEVIFSSEDRRDRSRAIVIVRCRKYMADERFQAAMPVLSVYWRPTGTEKSQLDCLAIHSLQ